MGFITSLAQYNKDFAIQHLMGVEGGDKYTNISSDKGGATRFGITEAKAKEHQSKWATYNFSGDMSTLPATLAYYIYDTDYWSALNLDAISKIHPLLADRLLDIGCNRGVGTAGQYLQRLLNVFNLRGTLYPDLKVDGNVGPGTITALNAFVAKRGFPGKRTLILALLSLQNTSYITIAEANPTQEDFSLGWANRVTEGFTAYLPLLQNPY